MKLSLSLSLSLFFNKTNSLSYEMNETLLSVIGRTLALLILLCLLLTF